MKIKNIKLQWNVLWHNFNNDKIENYNIFYDDFKQELYNEIQKKKTITNYDELKSYIDKWAHFYYWSKSECEILVSGLNTKSEADKIDIYRQIEMNMDNICQYLINCLKIEFK